MENKNDRFTVTSLVPEPEIPKYDHGYSEEQVKYIKDAKKAIELRNLVDQPVTLEEFKAIIVPWNRIHRTEQFILNPVKEKVIKEKKERVVKEKTVRVPKEPKPKKITKKELKEKMEDIVMKMAMGQSLDEEETLFYNEQVAKAGRL